MKRFFALALLLPALGAHAECPRTYQKAPPAIPDGAAADATAMLRAQEATQRYVRDIEAILACRAPLLSAHGHNWLVGQAEAAADAYNAQLHRFRERQELAAR